MATHVITSPVILDSLPYYDNDLSTDPELKALVDAEIVKELKSMPPLDPSRLPPELQLFQDKPLLAAELERAARQEALSSLDMTRYKLPGPTDDTELAWRVALDNAKAQLEHQKTRQLNQSLLQTYGANAWRVHNYLTEATAVQYEKALERLQDQTTELNRNRKNSQILAGNQLTSLEMRWTELISTVLQLELANVALEGELDDLQAQEREMGA
ncbi:hypothetical protein FRB96_004866 [Tulasnella sp. 330]|nr:hypothetical protein FRB96_004866 [Tulasnella sp. 330]KAG8885443.1 hypothetical protein FRB97_001166 [Tulasnella sp. 331]KAG8890076.1 hypothetical protein FRB98_001189 [Tulasnella sp. 332]